MYIEKMPGYVIHLAVGKVYEKNNKINNVVEFERGIIAPDLAEDKAKSHYGPYSSNPDLNRYLSERNISNEFNEGYFLHLLTDHLFYNKFLKEWNKKIYDDYDKLNDGIIKKYNITIPEELSDVVKITKGKPEILNVDSVYSFIDVVGSINIRQILKENGVSFQKKIEGIQFE